MARIPLTEDEADRLVAAPKTISGDLVWSHDVDRGWAKSELKVASELGVDLRVYSNINMKEPSLFSFALLVNRVFRIRGLCINRGHVNKHTNNEKWWPGTHKHRWTDRCRDRFAYTPAESISSDVGEAFRQFCTECAITFDGQIRPLPPRQIGFGEVP